MNKKRESFSLLSNLFACPAPQQVWIALGVVFVIFIQFALPTGWLYDLGVGTGTEQGQMLDQSVQTVHMQDQVEDFFFQNTPATVAKDDLIQCPLMRLRDTGYAGEHTNARKRTIVIPEYRTMSYPVGFVDKAINLFLTSALYNGYYLAPLEDGSYVCVYFDDYLLLRSGEELPTGYVRYATTEEKKMLHGMAEDYEVNPVYVLDMYRHGKVNWMLDFAIRIAVVVLLGLVYLSVADRIKKSKRH